jgi:hypothetical protein
VTGRYFPQEWPFCKFCTKVGVWGANFAQKTEAPGIFMPSCDRDHMEQLS